MYYHVVVLTEDGRLALFGSYEMELTREFLEKELLRVSGTWDRKYTQALVFSTNHQGARYEWTGAPRLVEVPRV